MLQNHWFSYTVFHIQLVGEYIQHSWNLQVVGPRYFNSTFCRSLSMLSVAPDEATGLGRQLLFIHSCQFWVRGKRGRERAYGTDQQIESIWVSRKRGNVTSIFSLSSLSYFLPQLSSQCRKRQDHFSNLLLCLPEVDLTLHIQSACSLFGTCISRLAPALTSTLQIHKVKVLLGKYNCGGQWIIAILKSPLQVFLNCQQSPV